MNVPIEECSEIIGYRQYWLLNDIEHKEIFKYLWDDCDTLEEFKELLYSDPNICNTKAAGWFLHYDSEAAECFLSQWFGRQKRRFCLDSKQKFIILENAGTKSMIPTAMLSIQSCNEHREEDYYVAIVDDDDFNPLLFRFHSLICSDDFKVNGQIHNKYHSEYQIQSVMCTQKDNDAKGTHARTDQSARTGIGMTDQIII